MTDRAPQRVRGPAVAALASAALAVVLLSSASRESAAPAAAEPLARSIPGKTFPPSALDGTPASSIETARSAAPSVVPRTSAAAATPDPRLTVVNGFAADFTRPGPDWVARTTRWTSEYLTDQFGQVDQTRVPVAALLSVDIHSSGEYSVDAAASYDTGLVLLIRAELSPTGWVITTVRPAAGGPTPT